MAAETELKNFVYARDGITRRSRMTSVMDQLIALELGGSNKLVRLVGRFASYASGAARHSV